MTTTTLTLTDFLLARIAEDEAVADEVHREGCVRAASDWTRPCDCGYPARVLAECEAKRGAVEAAWGDHVQIEGEWGMCRGQAALSAANDYPDVVRWLALPYADHPDYREEWRA